MGTTLMLKRNGNNRNVKMVLTFLRVGQTLARRGQQKETQAQGEKNPQTAATGTAPGAHQLHGASPGVFGTPPAR